MKIQTRITLVVALCVGQMAAAADEIKSYRLAVGESLILGGQKYICQETKIDKKESGIVLMSSSDLPLKVGETTIRCGEGPALKERHALRDLQQL